MEGRMLIFKVDTIEDGTRQELLEVRKNGVHPTALSNLSKQKLIEKKKIFYFSVQKGDELTLDIKIQETDMSVEMLQKY
jgi:phenylalanyl-tRNA synthetase alpha chain